MKQQGHEEETGKAKITPAFNLPCRSILHTVGPIAGIRLTHRDRELLASCYRSCLELAASQGIRRIAFPSISTGVYHFPVKEAAQIAVDTARQFVREHPGKLELIRWVLFDDATFHTYEEEMKER